jgi:predicted phage tail protein
MVAALAISGAAVGFAGQASAAADVPSAPTSLAGTATSAKTANLSWTAPTTGSPILGYNVYEGTQSGNEVKVNGSILAASTSTTVTAPASLVASGFYFEVTAVNAQGESPASSEILVTPFVAAVPGAPTGATATAGYTSALVSWTAPASDSAITGYTVASSPVGFTCSPTLPATSCTVSGLSLTTAYTFTVTATNGAGTGPSSAASAAVTPNVAVVPNAPVLHIPAPTANSVPLSWTAPTLPGDGAGILGYNIYEGTTAGGENYTTPVNGSSLVTGTTYTVFPLTTGTTYYFTVKAVNAEGSSPASNEESATPTVNAPGAPTGVTATAGNASAQVSWTAPASTGTSSITGYSVTSFPVIAPPVGCTNQLVLTCDFTGLGNGTAYTFTVVAINGSGPGPSSAPSAAVTPAVGVPNAPTALTATFLSTTSDTLTWTLSTENGSTVTGYNVYEATTSGGPWTFFGSTSGAVIHTLPVTGLTPGVTYYFTVKASSAYGLSAASNQASLITGNSTAPDAPTAVLATSDAPVGNSVAVSWTAPANNGGSAITGYSVTSSPASGPPAGCTLVAALTCDFTGLTNGVAYTFTVTATNTTGTSVASAPSAAATPATVPNAPASLTATDGNGEVVLTWPAVTGANTGGSPITGYEVRVHLAGDAAYTSHIVTGLTYTATGLTNGQNYWFSVRAINAYGESDSAWSGTTTPAAVAPGAPTAVTATPGNTSVAVSWTAPVSDGGSAIAGYNVFVSTIPGGLGTAANGSVLITGTTATVSGLTNGISYYFTVEAVNAMGPSSGSSQVTAIPTSGPTAPGAPTGVTAFAGSASAIVAWTAPADGGSAITGYVVTPYMGFTAQAPQTFASTATIESVSGLTPGTAYTFTVSAINAIGTGAASGFSNFVTPTAPVPPAVLQPGGTLTQGQSLVSANGLYTAVLQPDGNFVVYGPTGAIWNTSTNNSAQDTLVLQSDGNLVLYGPAGHPLWNTSTNPATATGLVMQNDGNLVLYGTSGALWSSKTGKL